MINALLDINMKAFLCLLSNEHVISGKVLIKAVSCCFSLA